MARLSKKTKDQVPPDVAEMSAMAGLFNDSNRVNDALPVEPAKPGEGS